MLTSRSSDSGRRERSGEVGADGLEPLADIVAHGVLAGHGQRAAGQIDHEAAPVWAFRAQGHGDAAAARTQIRKAGGAVAAFEGRFDEVLGFSGRGMRVAGVTRKSLP